MSWTADSSPDAPEQGTGPRPLRGAGGPPGSVADAQQIVGRIAAERATLHGQGRLGTVSPEGDRPAGTVSHVGVTRPREAATVVLARDGGAGGLEVLLVQRNLRSGYAAGVYLFPGGALDVADRELGALELCEGRSDAGASAVLGVPSGGLAWWVAAIRECFEEVGVLLASPLASLSPEVLERLAPHRSAVEAAPGRLAEVLRAEGLRLAADSLHYLSHWIAPPGAPRRYDTRFFVAAIPPGQEPSPDGRELVEGIWLRPVEALARHRAGEVDLLLPTVQNLKEMARFPDVSALLAWAASARKVPTIRPRVRYDPDGPNIVLPGEPGYDEASADEPLPAGLAAARPARRGAQVTRDPDPPAETRGPGG